MSAWVEASLLISQTEASKGSVASLLHMPLGGKLTFRTQPPEVDLKPPPRQSSLPTDPPTRSHLVQQKVPQGRDVVLHDRHEDVRGLEPDLVRARQHDPRDLL